MKIRFVQANKKVLARRPITVTAASATLDGPSTATAGSIVEITFTGPPPGSGDYVAVSEIGVARQKIFKLCVHESRAVRQKFACRKSPAIMSCGLFMETNTSLRGGQLH